MIVILLKDIFMRLPKKKVSKREQKQINIATRNHNLSGTGVYIFQNVTSGDFMLPKKSLDGKKLVKKNEQFQGDSYFMRFVGSPNNILKLIRRLEETKEKVNNMTDKLILDQPDQITTQGKVEHVIADTPKAVIKENDNNKTQENVLITENPIDGLEIILG